MEDSELLRRYAIDHDEGAFAELVHLYVDMVHSVASRQLGSQVRLADDVTQSVFLLLARKAHSLQSHPTLAGWIHCVTQHLAAKAQRSERRTKQREQEAALMTDPSDSDDNIDQIIPLLDKAVSTLTENDRVAILIRFYLKKPMREVGLALGISEAAAKMRVGRALERLRRFFDKQGLHCSIGAITLILAEKSISAAPIALPSAILNNNLLRSALLPVSTIIPLTLFMTNTKLKIALLVLVLLIGSVSLHEYRATREVKRNVSSPPEKKSIASETKRNVDSPVRLTSTSAQKLDASHALVLKQV